MGTMLEVRNLWAGYTDFVVRDLSFSVAGGELVAFWAGTAAESPPCSGG